ncbi:hypothetical protein [Tissierella praeacuta]|uniref:Uncharacterized protein n=1 Tax=Tissierella praeacuta DSM 18095 TaxID=1123404 RepID=A0A1M4VNT3_9FIRM|nr:hypothetical protein [Tissierella praeacuta]HAE91287.1 hypothetical protein [Tissierella sp.]MBU5256540.1 hypothetical protein [Tissierella praeacuta]TCU79352.1 hypothetical protein EV204_101333 [Tissierella praeacuta]SHE70507.1 hypothetical protein SAMN02745784_01547 [Tissierella praeacuta DSM 18095]SUO99005.1 Uncharacterised protein [Tissierella praeacuta]
MKKRFISRKHIERAYKTDTLSSNLDLNLEPMEEKIDKLPKEMFQILGEIILFIENTNKFEGDKNHENQ